MLEEQLTYAATYADVAIADLKIQEELIKATKYASDLERSLHTSAYVSIRQHTYIEYASDLERSKRTSEFIDASRKLVEEMHRVSS